MPPSSPATTTTVEPGKPSPTDADLLGDLDIGEEGESIRINLFREWPKRHAGQPCSGWVTELDPPINVAQVAEAYGGQKYRVEIRKSGRFHAMKRFEIAGDPILPDSPEVTVDSEWEYAEEDRYHREPDRPPKIEIGQISDLLRCMRETVSPPAAPVQAPSVLEQLDGITQLLEITERLRPPDGGGSLAGAVISGILSKIPDDFFPAVVDRIRGSSRPAAPPPTATLPAPAASSSEPTPGDVANQIIKWIASSMETGKPSPIGIAALLEYHYPDLFEAVARTEPKEVYDWIVENSTAEVREILDRDDCRDIVISSAKAVRSMIHDDGRENAPSVDELDLQNLDGEQSADEPTPDPGNDRGGETRSDGPRPGAPGFGRIRHSGARPRRRGRRPPPVGPK